MAINGQTQPQKFSLYRYREGKSDLEHGKWFKRQDQGGPNKRTMQRLLLTLGLVAISLRSSLYVPQPKTVFVDIVARRRDKGRVRIVEAVEQGGNLRHCRIHRIRLGDILFGLLDFCVPVQAMQLGIVIVLLYVRSNGAQHLRGVVTIKLR